MSELSFLTPLTVLSFILLSVFYQVALKICPGIDLLPLKLNQGFLKKWKGIKR